MHGLLVFRRRLVACVCCAPNDEAILIRFLFCVLGVTAESVPEVCKLVALRPDDDG